MKLLYGRKAEISAQHVMDLMTIEIHFANTRSDQHHHPTRHSLHADNESHRRRQFADYLLRVVTLPLPTVELLLRELVLLVVTLLLLLL